MLDNLRGMAVFASVVRHGSFSGAAKELGITTSAVSQQIRSLENDMGVILLHRSTRKLSLTEAGAGFYESAKAVVEAAEQGRTRVNQLRDELAGNLRISTTPELGVNHVLPALSKWIAEHDDLSIHFEADNAYVDMIEERIDIAIRMSQNIQDSNLSVHPLLEVQQVLVASPDYLKKHEPITDPKELSKFDMIGLSLFKDPNTLDLTETSSHKKLRVKVPGRLETNNVFMAKTMAKQGLGIARMLTLDIQNPLKSGELVPVLPDYQLPSFNLYAVTLRRDQQPIKIKRCLEVLEQHFKKK